KALAVETVVKNEAGQTVLTGEKHHLSSLSGSMLMQTRSIAPGQYRVSIKIAHGKKVLQQKTFSYHKKPLPKWVGNTLGISKTPPRPWTDVKVDKTNDVISIWGRQYE